jgi:hypothetical protein
MLAGIAGEQYNVDRDLTKLFNTFYIVMQYRPDVAYLSEFLKYLVGSVPADERVINFYLNTANLLIKKNSTNHLSYAITYLNIGLEMAPGNAQLLQKLNECQSLLGSQNLQIPRK